jgi:murein DD-endopeptidase MepM/ murein hydrolase activator NlpD
MEYTIEWGDTLSSLAKKYNTTVSNLATLNKIADPNKIYAGQKITIPDVASQLQGADLNASNIKPGLPDITPEQTPIPTPTTADAIEKYTTDQLKNIQEERKKTQESIGVQSGETTAQTLVGLAQKAPTLDKATKLKEEMETSGATDLGNKLMVENTKLGVLKAELDGLNIAEQNEITSLQGITRGAIDREISVIQRKYNSLKASKQAEYLVQAATVSALQGNYELAKQAAQDAVNAYVYDYEQNVKTFDTIFNVYSDALRGFDEEEQNILKIAAQNARDKLDEVKAEKNDVANIMVKYPGAGITLSDTFEEAVTKAAQYEKEHPQVNANLKYITDDMGNVNVYDESSGVPVLIKSLGKVGQGNPQIAIAQNAAQTAYLENRGEDKRVSYEGYYAMYNTFKQNGGGSLENFYSLYPMTVYMDEGNQAMWRKFARENNLEKTSGGIDLNKIVSNND